MEKTYTVGQRVAYNTSPSYRSSASFTHFSKIIKLNLQGCIWLENGMKFNKRNNQLKTKDHSYPRAILMDATEGDRIHAKARSRREQRDAVTALQQALSTCTHTYSGEYFLTPEQLNAIKALTTSLTKPKTE